MTRPVLDTKDFAGAVIDALAAHICVVDKDGIIIAVNRAWRNFAGQNPPSSRGSDVGAHYLKVCQGASGPGSEEAQAFALGVQSVLKRDTELFQLEYPCHSPTQSKWFLGRVTPLDMEHGGAVISHLNITDRKLIEFDLARLAATDPLTDLSNRRYFLEHAELEVERVRRFGAAAAVMMFDLDHFKSVNDTYGHAMGDQALRCLAQACKAAIRQIDVLARLGGEEFIVMLPGINAADACEVAEKLRALVSETPIEEGQNRIKLTASFGVAEIWPSDQRIDDAMSRADSALYAAKRAGRNRVMSFTAVHFPAEKLRA